MRALVTGGAGFIGSHLADRFLQKGYEVRVLDNLDSRVHPRGVPRYLSKHVEFIRGSVTDRRTWERVLGGVDVVSHQAAYQDYMLDFSNFLAVNSISTALMYEVLVERNLHPYKVIVASSQAVYGEGQYFCAAHGLVLPKARKQERLDQKDWEVYCPVCGETVTPSPLVEDYPNPVNQYAVSKLAGEKIALGLGQIHRIPTVALRYSITQGPRQSLFNQYSGLLRIFTARLRASEPLIVYEDGKQTRDFVHVQDVVSANFCVLEHPVEYEAFNVGSGITTSVLEYAKHLISVLNVRAELSIPGQYRVGDNRHSVSSIEKLKNIGWLPKYGIKTILEEFVNWVDDVGGVPSGMVDAYQSMRSAGVVRTTA